MKAKIRVIGASVSVIPEGGNPIKQEDLHAACDYCIKNNIEVTNTDTLPEYFQFKLKGY